MIDDIEFQQEFISAVMRHRHEDVDAQQLQKRIEKIIPRLREGRNYVNPKEYADCVAYFLEDETADDARDFGSFSILGRMWIERVRWRDESKMVGVADLAKLAGVDRSTMHRLLKSAKTPFIWKGKKKLYDFNALESLRDAKCA